MSAVLDVSAMHSPSICTFPILHTWLAESKANAGQAASLPRPSSSSHAAEHVNLELALSVLPLAFQAVAGRETLFVTKQVTQVTDFRRVQARNKIFAIAETN